MKIVSGKIERAQRVCIYGCEGIGKTTLAAGFPDPLFIDTEGGTAHMDVKRVEPPRDWRELLMIIDEVAKDTEICKTLVLDTADWAEMMAVRKICADYRLQSIESAGYGKGYTYLQEEFSQLLRAFDSVIAAGVNVVVTAHAKMRKFEQPDEMGAYDRWEMKLTKQVAPLIKEWCDMLLFCNFQTQVIVGSDGKAKAQGGKRMLYTTHHACWDAKNRHGLPDEMPLSFDGLAHIFAVESAAEKVRKLMADAGVTEEEVLQIAARNGYYPEAKSLDDLEDKFLTGWVVKHWGRIVDLAVKARE